jgi:hypothetical protein
MPKLLPKLTYNSLVSEGSFLWLVICDRQQPMTNNTLKTIVFVNPVGAIGGAERALLTIMVALRKAQPNLKLHLIVGTDGALVEAAQNLGVQVKVLKLPDQLNQLGDSALKGNKSLEKIQRTSIYRIAAETTNL